MACQMRTQMCAIGVPLRVPSYRVTCGHLSGLEFRTATSLRCRNGHLNEIRGTKGYCQKVAHSPAADPGDRFFLFRFRHARGRVGSGGIVVPSQSPPLHNEPLRCAGSYIARTPPASSGTPGLLDGQPLPGVRLRFPPAASPYVEATRLPLRVGVAGA